MFPVSPVQILRVKLDNSAEKSELVVVEEPLAIRLGFGRIHNRQQRSVSVRMLTRTHDFELALGLVYSEGNIAFYNQIISVTYCVDIGKQAIENIVRVELKPDIPVNLQMLQRNFYASSSCGVCVKASIETNNNMICGLPKQKFEQNIFKKK